MRGFLAANSVAEFQGFKGTGALKVHCTTPLAVSAFQRRGDHTWALPAHPLPPG